MSDDPNTPNTLPVPTDAGEIESEITDLEEQMKDTKGDYYYSEPKQRRYRELIEARDAGGQEPARTGAVDAEIAQLEALMADTKSKYWSGDEAEALQARYRQLIETSDGGTPAEAIVLATRDFGMSKADAAVSWATAQRIEQALPAEVRAEVNVSLRAVPHVLRGAIAKGILSDGPVTVVPDFKRVQTSLTTMSAKGQEVVQVIAHRQVEAALGLGPGPRQVDHPLAQVHVIPAERRGFAPAQSCE